MSEKNFRRNIELLRDADKVLADAVDNTSPKKWDVAQDQSGSVNLLNKETKAYLHSSEGPLKEAHRWESTLKLPSLNTLFVYGLGLGYYYEPLKAWLNEKENYLIFIEDDLEIMKHFLSQERATEILTHPKIRILQLPKKLDNAKRFEELMLQFYKKPYQVTGLMYNIKNKVDTLLRVNTSIEYMINTHKWMQHEYESLGLPYYRNFYANILKLPESKVGSSLFQRFAGKPAIICGAGPSLKKNIDQIARLKNKALIIAGGTAINALNAAGINPHLGFGIDPNEDHALRILTNEAFMVPFFYHLRMYHTALNLLHGDLYYQNTVKSYPISYWVEEKLSIPSIPIDSGYNVVNTSFELAYALGCSPIITVGTDLAYSEGDSYAPILSTHPLAEGSLKFVTKTESEELIPRVDINGKPVLTLWKWMLEAVWYSKFLVNHPDAVVINATEGGIGFPGVPNMTLKEVEESFLKREFDFEGLIHALSLDADMPKSVDLQSVKECLEVAKKSLEKVIDLTGDISKEFQSISKEEKGSLYTQEIVDKLSGLEKEDAYSTFLELFNERYTDLIQKEIQSMDMKKDILEPDEIASRKAHLQSVRYELLKKAAQLNFDYMAKALKYIAFLENGHIKPSDKLEKLNVSAHENESASAIDQQVETIPGTSIEWRYSLKEGKLHGPSLFYDQGILVSDTFYSFGQKNGKSDHYFSDGTLESSQVFREGLPDQEHIFYDKDGGLRARIGYLHGKLDGRVELYHKNGKLKRLLEYKLGLKDGEEALYTEFDERIIEAHYKNGKPVGIARYYSPKGVVLKEVSYKDDGGVNRIMVRSSDDKLVELDQKKGHDFFDSVTAQTENLTESLASVFIHLKNFLLEIKNDKKFLKGHEELMTAINNELGQIGGELQQLSTLGQELIKESSMEDGKEPIWKTPATKKILDTQVTVLQDTVRKGIGSIRGSIDQVLSAYVAFYKNQSDKDQ